VPLAVARLSVRGNDGTLVRLDALAAERGMTRARLTRQLLDGALQGQPAPQFERPTEDELPELLAEKPRLQTSSPLWLKPCGSPRTRRRSGDPVDCLMALAYAVHEAAEMKPERRSPYATQDLAVA
jgi:hypothetical protein